MNKKSLSYRVISVSTIAFLLISCSQTPQLDNNKVLSYDFSTPARSPVTADITHQLGKPGESPHPQEYHSANGNSCRKLGVNQAVCYINGAWFKAVEIIASGG